MKYVIDTSIFIDILRSRKELYKYFSNIEKKGAKMYIPTIVIYELFSASSAKDPLIAQDIRGLIKDFQRIELTENIAIRAGGLYRVLGKVIGAQDYIIAATALESQAILITLNKKHFSLIPGLEIYPEGKRGGFK